MNELAKHIEVLLLENDCVIIPGFGGFVTHHVNARRIEEEELFLPPTRTIGFNPQLKINDGLLIQSYMQIYNTDFADASKMIDKAVEDLTHCLHETGKIEIQGIGEMTIGINNTYEFHPYEEGLMTPYLYGLSSFEISALSTILKKEEKKTSRDIQPSKETFEIKINRTLLRHTAAVAAAIAIFFFLSVPVENTYIEEENYAMLGSEGMFEAIKNQSLATSILAVHEQNIPVQQSKATAVKKNANSKNIKPISVRTEKVAPRGTEISKASHEIKKTETVVAPIVKQEPPAISKGPAYNVIVASVGTKADAAKMVEQLKAKGHDSATVIEGNGRVRVCLMSFANQPDAYRKINTLKENGSFKDAWVLTTN